MVLLTAVEVFVLESQYANYFRVFACTTCVEEVNKVF